MTLANNASPTTSPATISSKTLECQTPVANENTDNAQPARVEQAKPTNGRIVDFQLNKVDTVVIEPDVEPKSTGGLSVAKPSAPTYRMAA